MPYPKDLKASTGSSASTTPDRRNILLAPLQLRECFTDPGSERELFLPPTFFPMMT